MPLDDRVYRILTAYGRIPLISSFVDDNGIDRMREQILENYNRIKAETRQMVEAELTRIKADPYLCNLIPKGE